MWVLSAAERWRKRKHETEIIVLFMMIAVAVMALAGCAQTAQDYTEGNEMTENGAAQDGRKQIRTKCRGKR